MLAIYRKYRPKLLKEFFGQEQVIQVLQNAAKQDKFAHAYLFYGSRGSGKTTTARLLAKLANCEGRQKTKTLHDKGEPCNKCRVCTEIDSGRALDIIEIDAASNRGIDEIRNLKEGIKLSPSSFKYKVFIIDETHMLTKEAFNALLKTLEEPPAHAIIILATTEYEKVPATISSRTQRFHFRRLHLSEILGKLNHIVQSEKIKITDEALELIAALAEGSLRDAESLLDQINSLDQNIELQDVEKIAGKIGYRKIFQLSDFILKKDLSGALKYLNEIDQEGYNLVQLNKELIHYLRRALTLKLSSQIEEIYAKELTKDELIHLRQHAGLGTEALLVQLLKALIRAYSEMRYSPFAIVPLEVALIEQLQ